MTINYTDVHLRHESRTILSGVNLQAHPGEMIYLMGLVGSGKTTMLSSMYGDTPIYNGRAMILGHDMRRIKSSKLQYLRRQIGIVHQELRLLPSSKPICSFQEVLSGKERDAGCYVPR